MSVEDAVGGNQAMIATNSKSVTPNGLRGGQAVSEAGRRGAVDRIGSDSGGVSGLWQGGVGKVLRGECGQRNVSLDL